MQLSTVCLARINAARHIYIAYSGGLDSHVLLHICSLNPQIKNKLTAVYVHHGLQKIADDWAVHCQQQAQQLNIPFKLLHVNAVHKGKSPEEGARDARYQALKALLNEGDVLCVAQHREDQLETVLLQLFRGAGVQGLSAMAEISSFGQGKLLRPLLDCSQQAIKDYAINQQLNWIEDPSNQCDDFERNFLRNQIIPTLKTHWQALDKTVARSAKHCATAQSLLSELAINLLDKSINLDNSLSISGLLSLEAAKQQLVIRQWFAHFNLKMPSVDFIERLFEQVIHAKPSANPELKRSDCSIRRYQNKLYCLTQTQRLPTLDSQVWEHTNERLDLKNNGTLQRFISNNGIPVSLWESSSISVRYRTGGEKIALSNRKGHHSLKNLYQEASIPPWEREKIPLLYFDDKLVAIADLWVSADVFSDNGNTCYQLNWNRDF
ncbi:MAG: tRNA lysidine(34) synthetase TilS [Methylococcaceae bacterium]|nr:tRNA lysidine(34) synthetase TilS [Methylococcaceae bacterium]